MVMVLAVPVVVMTVSWKAAVPLQTRSAFSSLRLETLPSPVAAIQVDPDPPVATVPDWDRVRSAFLTLTVAVYPPVVPYWLLKMESVRLLSVALSR